MPLCMRSEQCKLHRYNAEVGSIPCLARSPRRANSLEQVPQANAFGAPSSLGLMARGLSSARVFWLSRLGCGFGLGAEIDLFNLLEQAAAPSKASQLLLQQSGPSLFLALSKTLL